ncbi:MAG: cupin domain-containing protein [Gammaproteobacteria bacterium]|nr:cupin domain-containing protein [Gammaproteobacteria bacterium]
MAAAVDQRAIAREWAARGFHCELWMDPPGQCWEDYVHTMDELVLVVEGQVEFEVDGRLHHPAIGVELLIPAGTPHSVRNVGHNTSRWLYGYRQQP